MSTLRARLQRLQGKANEQKSIEAQAVEPAQQTELTEQKSDQQYKEQVDEYSSLQLADETACSALPFVEERKQEHVYHSLLKLSSIPAEELYCDKWTKMHVQLAHNEFGSFLLRTLHVSANEAIGMHKFREWQEAGEFLNAFYPDNHANHTQFLFLDLETTGLGSGAGNVPFMVGLAFWDNDGITVQQALIRHPAEERAMLAYVHHLTAYFTHLVTYNGKSFDWPLIHSRFVMNGMRQKIWEPLHVDLLHPSRAIWRNTLESCKLSHIEKMRLGIVRLDDLPGSEAPTRYFQFLNQNDPELLYDVFRHNEIDMLSLVTLAIRFAHLLSNRELSSVVQQPSDPEEMVRTGLWLEKMGNSMHSQQLFELAAYIPRQKAATLMLLAMRDKKINNYERAIMLWQRIVDYNSYIVTREQVEAAIELSMYYEHKTKQYDLALYYAELALDKQHDMVTSTRRSAAQKKKEIEQLDKRINRLKKKTGNSV